MAKISFQEENLPSGSLNKKVDNKAPKKEVKQVTSSKGVEVKTSLYKRLGKLLFATDFKTALNSVWVNDILPSIKMTISDSINNFTSTLLMDGDYTNRYRRNINYAQNGRYNRMMQVSGNNTKPHTFQGSMEDKLSSIGLETRDDAYAVISEMKNQISNYGVASVSDFKRTVGITPEYTDDKFGWSNFDNAIPQRNQDYFVIMVPPIEKLN